MHVRAVTALINTISLTRRTRGCYGRFMLRYVLLGLMADGKPTHGYALMKAYEERAGLRVSIGNVYRELQRLVADGMIVSATNPPGADPRRTPYAVTASGRQAFATYLAAPAYAVLRGAPDPMCHRLALVGDMEPDQIGPFLDDLHDELWSQTKALERERAMVSQRSKRGENVFPMRSILLGRRARHLAADIEMVDEMRVLFGSQRKRKSLSASQPAVVAETPVPRSSRRTRGQGTAG
jgi:DNA-binding PadR family transcriptional regulator